MQGDSNLAKVDLFIEGADWLDNNEKINTSMIIKELLFNTMKYGKSPMFEILLYDKVITVIDDGGKFNLLEFKDAPSSGYRGGKKTVDLYLNTHKNIEINYRWRNDKGENIYSFRKSRR